MCSCSCLHYHIVKKNITKHYLQTSHWSDVTTGEVGSMVREAIKRGEAAMAKEAQENGAAHQIAE
ncbi:hypothetical protein [Anaerospora sp.]|uniref:hypothetical protein n=1 Tax=Anaerospora sp. TaxID=1960278 RepID=UPI00289E8DA6|nr:hypothetical protein [Anaerospora sp.]